MELAETEKRLDLVLSNVSRTNNREGGIPETQETLMGEAFSLFVCLRSDRRNYLLFIYLLIYLFGTRYIHKQKERD